MICVLFSQDWNSIGLSGKEEGDAVSEEFQRHGAASFVDSQADQAMYDSSNLGVGDILSLWWSHVDCLVMLLSLLL